MDKRLLANANSARVLTRARRATERVVLVLGVRMGSTVAGRPGWELWECRGEVQVQGDDEPGGWRPCTYAAIHPGEAVRMDCGCREDSLCRRHRGAADALRWWTEAHRRDDARNWMTTASYGELGYGKCFPSRAEAADYHETTGLPVVCRDGHGRAVARIPAVEVTRG